MSKALDQVLNRFLDYTTVTHAKGKQWSYAQAYYGFI